MTEREFKKRILEIKSLRMNIFTDRIRQSEKYKLLSMNPEKCNGTKETELIKKLKQIDAIWPGGNYDWIAAVAPGNRKQKIMEAKECLCDIEKLVRTIEWE